MKKVVALKDLPASVTQALRTIPRNLPRELHVESTTEAFRHYTQEEALFDLATGQVIPAPVEMPAGWRGDEDYFVPANRLRLHRGIGYVGNSGTGYATLQVVKDDFDALTVNEPPPPEVSKEEWQALDAIASTIPRGRAGYFKVLKLGAYSMRNPYVRSLIAKGLLTRSGEPTTAGRNVRISVWGYDLPSRPLGSGGGGGAIYAIEPGPGGFSLLRNGRRFAGPFATRLAALRAAETQAETEPRTRVGGGGARATSKTYMASWDGQDRGMLTMDEALARARVLRQTVRLIAKDGAEGWASPDGAYKVPPASRRSTPAGGWTLVTAGGRVTARGKYR